MLHFRNDYVQRIDIYTAGTIIHPIFTSKMASSNSHHCTRTIFYGPVINPVSLTSFNTLPHCLLCIDPSGKIEWMIAIVYEHQLQKTLASKGFRDVKLLYLKS